MLVARICQLYPNECAGGIISRFFVILLKWSVDLASPASGPQTDTPTLQAMAAAYQAQADRGCSAAFPSEDLES